MAKEIKPTELIFAHDFANVMDVSSRTISNWLNKGYLNDIRKVYTPGGVKYYIFDVFRYAHPEADKNTIEMLIFQYRTSQSRAKKNTQNRKYGAKKRKLNAKNEGLI